MSKLTRDEINFINSGHLPSLNSVGAIYPKLKAQRRFMQSSVSAKKLKVKVISTYMVKNDIFEKYIEQLNLDADKIVDIVPVRDTFYIWYKG